MRVAYIIEEGNICGSQVHFYAVTATLKEQAETAVIGPFDPDAWLQQPNRISEFRWDILQDLRAANLKTGRAWVIKEHAMCLWKYKTWGWAPRAWMQWYQWGIRSRLEPVKKVARFVRRHLEDVLTAIATGATSARAEGINALIRKLKRDARGFRNWDRLRAAIYFYFGGLDLYQDIARS